MQVNAQYAREHLEELIASAERGEDVEIACKGKPLAKLIVMPTPLQAETRRERILGAGRGELLLTDEEWQQMKEEDARLMDDAPLMTTGEI